MYASLTLAERARFGALTVEKRRWDFLLGRVTAKQVVAQAVREQYPADDWPPGIIELPAEPGGAPYARLAPEAAPRAGFAAGDRLPVSVSISHTEGRALCAAAFVGAGAPRRVIGVDLGRVEPRSAELQETFFTAAERAWVRAGAPGEADLRANLVWCAKEAALKVLGVGLTVDTLQLDCVLGDGAAAGDGPADPFDWPLRPADGEWHPVDVRLAPALVPGGSIVRGVWRELGGWVAVLARADAADLPPPQRTSGRE